MKKHWNNLKKGGESLLVASVVGALIAGCGGGGGGGGGNPSGSNASSLSGTVASGAPVSKGMGYALDAKTGTKIPFTTDADGKYSVNLNNLTGPFLIHVRGISSGGAPVDMYSLATTARFGKTVNVTPLTDIVVGYAAGKTTSQLEAACTANLGACPTLFNGIVANLALSNSGIIQALPASVLAAFTVDPATFDAISTPFTPDHTKVDGLLDALQVVPPAAGGTSYAINLAGATPTPLITVPVTVAATGTAPTSGPAPTPAAVTQAANLATALAEIQAWVAAFNQSMAAAAPGYPSAASISAGLDPAFLLDSANGAAFANAISTGQAMSAGSQIIAGGLAPYSGAAWGGAAAGPAANVTYDANNCVTSLWSYFGVNSLISGIWSFNKTITNPTGCVGTWKLAGDKTQYYVEIHALFTKSSGTGGTSYSSGFQIDTSADDTLLAVRANPYASVAVSGPGLTTLGNFMAKGNGVAVTVPVTTAPPAGFSSAKTGQNIRNSIDSINGVNDAYYGSSSVLEDCAALRANATSTTPCFDSTAAIAGSDYVVRFKDAAGAVLETVQYRLNTSLAATSVPDNWFPTITGVTPNQARLIPANTATSVTYTWTLPAGAHADWGGVWLNGALGPLWQNEQPVTATTSNTINIPATAVTATPTIGGVSVLAPVGGLKIGATLGF